MIAASMPRALINILLLLVLSSFVLAQGGLDILEQPVHARAAAVGINDDALRNPHLLADPGLQHQVVLAAWSRISDVGGVQLESQQQRWAFGLDVVRVGDLEARGNTPSVEPLNTFQYSVLRANAAYGWNVQGLAVGVALEAIQERSQDASALGFATNISASYPVLSSIYTAAGLRHLGRMADLNSQRSDLPTEAWIHFRKSFDQIDVELEFNTGPAPLKAGVDVGVIRILHFMGGLQFENADDGIRLHPSLGFVLDRQQFSLGFALSDLTHSLGMRQHFSLYWNF
jgi:hypothetical protein